MMPLLPFVAGLVAGAAVISALRSERARSVLDDTGSRLRTVVSEAESGVRAAAESGLAMLRRSAPQTEPTGAAETASPANEPVGHETVPTMAADGSTDAHSAPVRDVAPAKAKARRAPRQPRDTGADA